MTAGIMKIVNALWRKTKQNTEMSDEEHSDSEFYYPEEHETAENGQSPWSVFWQSWASEDTGMKS